MRLSYTVVMTPDSTGGWLVEVPALPGCLTEGGTLSEALLQAEDAIAGYLAVLQEDGDPLPRESRGVTVDLGRRREALLRKVAVSLPGPGVKVA